MNRVDPLRVLCVFSCLDRGGAETMCMNLYRNIDRSKVQFDFVKHTNEEGAYEEEIAKLGGIIYKAPNYKVYNHLSYCKWWDGFLRSHQEYQIIHGHYFTISNVYFNIAKRNERITIGHAHSTNMKGIIKQRYIKNIEQYSDYCIACSKEAGEWMFPHKNYMVLHNAIDLDLFQPNDSIREQIRHQLLLDDTLVVGTVANFNTVKNPFGLIEIFRNIHQKDHNTKLLWVGDGPLRQKIEQKIEELHLSDSIILMGVRPDVAKLLQAMDIFVLPSFFEGLPVTLIEAQAVGLPCVCSDTVSREANITGLCKYIPIKDYDCWVNTVFNNINAKTNTKNLLSSAGYDIGISAELIQNMYLDIMKQRYGVS